MALAVNDFGDICRICLEKGRLLPIFGIRIKAGNIDKIIHDHSDAISKYSDVHVSIDDGLPQKMCYGCLFLLNSAVQFKTTCERSNDVLNYLLKNGEDIADDTGSCFDDVDKLQAKLEADYDDDDVNYEEEISIDSFRASENCSRFVVNGSTTNKLSNHVEHDHGSLLFISPSKETDVDTNNDGDDIHKDVNFTDDSDDSDPISSKSSNNINCDKEVISNINDSDPTSSTRMVKHTYLQIVADKDKKKFNRKRKKKDKKAEFKEISKTVNDVANYRENCDSVPEALHELVMKNYKVRDHSTSRWFVEKSRANFTPVVVPGKGKKYQCKVCQIIVNGSSTHNHSQLHIGYKIMCELCGKGFVSNFALKQHQMTWHGREKHLTCQYCNYKTGYKFELNVHERLHTGERPFVCDHCGKSFYRKLCLMKHLSLHTNIRPHKCQVCSKSFYLLDELKRHINANHDRRYMYKCDQCNMLYAKAGTVRKHLITQHSVSREQQGKIPRVYFH